MVITGSSTLAPLMVEIAKAYEKTHSGIRIDVQMGGSSRGITDVRSGAAQIGMVSRALTPQENDLVARTIALDGIAVIVHKSNPVASLSDQQIKDIYTGKLTLWNQVGGKDAPISVINKAEGRSTLELFLHYFQLKNSDIKAQVVIGDNQQGIKTLLANPNAIAYVSVGAAQYEAEQGVALKLLPMAGIEANLEQIQQGRFPLSRELILVTQKETSALVRDFIHFALSSKVQQLVNDQYFVPLTMM